MRSHDTIAAIATAPGLAALSLVRVSGPDAIPIASACFSGKMLQEVESHTAHVGLWEYPNASKIDRVVATVFRSPRTPTGEDLVEVTCHGGDYVAALVLESLIDQGARLASPGEFTQRAFLSGKIDLTQAEAVAELIHSTSTQAHQVSLSAYEGHYSKELEKLRTAILELCALAELEIDFTDEDVEFADRGQIKTLIDNTLIKIEDLLQTVKLGMVVREGIRVVIAGPPNAGKSTLLNSLSGRDRAIVSPMPGTTRDTLEVDCELGGLRFRFIDTAGLRQTSDTIEQEGVQRAQSVMEKADIVVYVYDLLAGLTKEDTTVLNSLHDKSVIIVGNKVDLISEPVTIHGLQLSAKNGLEALEPLIHLLLEQAKQDFGTADAAKTVTNARHQSHLKNAYQALQSAKQALKSNQPPDIFSIDLHGAARELGLITGAITNETILGAIFSRFCIGK
ncbi:MAG: tRNA uridine-5-carboxymethylaminomethyl(34) synthesis GTPase MnmE [Bacteroidetes bacterium]|nr:tRNA uridine-5-carboxymethylaminomethyl(34) synthesis GTPase MnmE [Bacteroidota bacterium]MCY4232834.1 tRNA uridine-5-carboxymethylaminomethyl(34) synthesis GTPase MnmE [Bacteroidota bacterium]